MATPGVSMMRPIARRFAQDGRRIGTTRAQHVAHRQRRRQLIPIGIDAQGPTSSSSAEVVLLRKDLVNIVGSSSGTEVEITIDSDGRIRLYSLGGGGGGGGTTYFPGGW